jgi:Domain of unknown function (DUF4192)
MNICLPTKIKLSNPAELVAALPYLVGFYPRDSMVVVCLQGPSPRIGLAVRADLPPTGYEEELAHSLTGPVLARQPAGVILVVVGGGQPHPLLGLPGTAAVSVVSRAFDQHGVVPMQAIWAESLDKGATWSCFERCCGGRLPDPATSKVAAAITAAGMVTFADRDEMARLVAPDDDQTLARRGALLDAAVGALDRALSEDPDAVIRRHLTLVLDAVDAAGRGELPVTDDQIVRLALALADRSVRDWCLRLCRDDDAAEGSGCRAAAAERLWLALTRATPAPELAGPATLAAFTAYLRGNGALAGMALERALQAWPGHDLAALLALALETGMPPSTLARIADDAIADAEQAIADGIESAGR